MTSPGLEELVGLVELDEVRCIETHGRLKVSPGYGARSWGPGDFEPALDLQTHPVSWGRTLEIWFRLSLDADAAMLCAAVSVMYRRASDAPISPEVRREFLERVAVMAAVPYLRAEIHSLAATLQIGVLVVPIIRSGEARFEGLLDGE